MFHVYKLDNIVKFVIKKNLKSNCTKAEYVFETISILIEYKLYLLLSRSNPA